LLAGDTKDEDGNKGEQDTGHSLAVFYEKMIGQATVGVAELTYADDGDDETDLALDLRARYELDEQMHLLGGLTYTHLLDSDVYDDGNGYGINLGVRYNF